MEIVDKFFKMEKEVNLFELNQNGVPVWDIFRMDIYLRYYWPILKQTENTKKNIKLLDLYKGLIDLFKSVYYLFTVKSENLVVPCSRYKNEKNEYYDKASLNIINSLNDKFIFETHSIHNNYKYRSANNYISFLIKFIKVNDTLSFSNYNLINNALIKSFGESKVDYDFLNALYRKFIKEYKYYKSLFKIKHGIKRVFFVQNGLQKGLIKAAREKRITTFELQHGSFERDHLAYSYPNISELNKMTFNADYLLTFGEYWGSYFNVTSKIIPIGNDCFNTTCNRINEDFILIVSSIIHGDVLSSLSLEIAEKYPQKKIIYKLHSNEYGIINKYKSLFAKVGNIVVITNELSVNDLIAQSELVVLVNSTVLYEALNVNKKVAIYKRVNYNGLKHLFETPNVYLINCANDISNVLNCSLVLNPPNYFMLFDIELFQLILQKY